MQPGSKRQINPVMAGVKSCPAGCAPGTSHAAGLGVGRRTATSGCPTAGLESRCSPRRPAAPNPAVRRDAHRRCAGAALQDRGQHSTTGDALPRESPAGARRGLVHSAVREHLAEDVQRPDELPVNQTPPRNSDSDCLLPGCAVRSPAKDCARAQAASTAAALATLAFGVLLVGLSERILSRLFRSNGLRWVRRTELAGGRLK